ncbi:hypothetical protein [Actinoplanes italicus]|uniref:hypothetical protein n=1 Tax=Actinoplanes italicus TaxID=113567 RepID=UPI0011B1F9C4|nr:hypothetical protein [Actinoplanes italicus]
MHRAEAIPVDGSRSTTEPPTGREPAALPPAHGQASPEVTTPVLPAGGGTTIAVRPAVHPPVPAGVPRRDDWPGAPAETRTGSGSVTRRTGRRRGAIATRRLVGL